MWPHYWIIQTPSFVRSHILAIAFVCPCPCPCPPSSIRRDKLSAPVAMKIYATRQQMTSAVYEFPRSVLRCEHKVECARPVTNKINYSSGRDLSLRGPAGDCPPSRAFQHGPPAQRSAVDYFNWTKPMMPRLTTKQILYKGASPFSLRNNAVHIRVTTYILIISQLVHYL
jgi:hypothetical protein